MSMFSGYKNFVVFEPREKIKKKIYRCDKRFHLDGIKQIYQIPVGKIGCIYLNGKDVKLNIIEPFNKKHFKSKSVGKNTMHLIGETGRGGQSALRISRNRKIQRNKELKKVAEQSMEAFYDFDTNKCKVDLMVISGPASLKKELGGSSSIKKYLQPKFFPQDHFDIRSIIENFYGDLVDVKDCRIEKPKQIMETNPEKLIIGEKELEQHITMCNIDELYVGCRDKLREIKKRLNHQPKLILIENSQFLDQMGGVIGIKYY